MKYIVGDISLLFPSPHPVGFKSKFSCLLACLDCPLVTTQLNSTKPLSQVNWSELCGFFFSIQMIGLLFSTQLYHATYINIMNRCISHLWLSFVFKCNIIIPIFSFICPMLSLLRIIKLFSDYLNLILTTGPLVCHFKNLQVNGQKNVMFFHMVFCSWL